MQVRAADLLGKRKGLVGCFFGPPGCCARAPSGHTAALPKSVMNSRRRISWLRRSPQSTTSSDDESTFAPRRKYPAYVGSGVTYGLKGGAGVKSALPASAEIIWHGHFGLWHHSHEVRSPTQEQTFQVSNFDLSSAPVLSSWQKEKARPLKSRDIRLGQGGLGSDYQTYCQVRASRMIATAANKLNSAPSRLGCGAYCRFAWPPPIQNATYDAKQNSPRMKKAMT